MRHKLKLSLKGKIKAWLDLCDFCLELMKKNLSRKQFKQRLIKIQREHSEKNKRILEGWAKL